MWCTVTSVFTSDSCSGQPAWGTGDRTEGGQGEETDGRTDSPSALAPALQGLMQSKCLMSTAEMHHSGRRRHPDSTLALAIPPPGNTRLRRATNKYCVPPACSPCHANYLIPKTPRRWSSPPEESQHRERRGTGQVHFTAKQTSGERCMRGREVFTQVLP